MNDITDALAEQGFRIVRTLGENTVDGRTTWLCERAAGGGRVVIKHFSFDRQGADWDGFTANEREIDALRAIEHPGVPRFIDAFPVGNGFALVQAFIPAPPLSSRRNWSVDEVLLIARNVLEILVYLQQQAPPILHRDIKPDNILHDPSGRTWLIDFGLARRLDTGPATLATSGTPGFMAPEQFFRAELSTSTDLYGLGATLVTLLTRTAPADVATLVDHTFRFDLQGVRDQLPQPIFAWLERLVDPDPKTRYPDAATAQEALLAAFRARPAPPPRVMPQPVVPLIPRFPWGRFVFGMTIPLIVVGSIVFLSFRESSSISSQISQALSGVAINGGGQIVTVNDMMTCSGGANVTLTPATLGDVKRLNVQAGCTARLEGVKLERVDVLGGGTVSVQGGEIESLSATKMGAPAAMTITIDGASLGRINLTGGHAELNGVKLGRLDADQDAEVQARGLRVETVYSNGAALTFDEGRVGEGLHLSGGSLRGRETELAARPSLGGRVMVALDEPSLVGEGGRGWDSDEAVVVLRAPIASQPVRLGAYGRTLAEGEPMEPVVAELTARRDGAVTRAAEAAAQREAVRALTDATCGLGAGCLASEAKATRGAEATFAVAQGRVTVATASAGRACFDKRVGAVTAASGLDGEVQCAWRVGREGATRVVQTTKQRYLPK